MNKEEVDKFCKEYYGYTIEESDKDIGYWMEKHHELQQENNQLKEQLKTKHEGFMASVEQNCEYATILVELRSWLEEYYDYSDCIKIKAVLNKLNELEGKNENV